MSMRIDHLATGTNLGFDHRYCAGCQEVRLHRFGRCVSFDRHPDIAPQTIRPYKPSGWNHKGPLS